MYEDRYKFFLDGLKNTIILTLLSFILGTILGIMLFALRRSRNNAVSKISNALNSFLTEIPTLVLLMIFVYEIFGSSSVPIMWSVMIALMMKEGAYISEIFKTVLDGIDGGEIEAAMTLGLSRMQRFQYIILPQVVLAGTGLYKNQFIVTMQETSVVGYLAIVDLTRASSIISSRTMDSMISLIIITILYFLIGFVAKKLLGLPGKRKHLGGDAE